MKSKKWLPYILFLLITLAVGGLSAIFVMKGMPAYEELAKPPLTPPSILFPIAWSILYVLMGLGAARVWIASPRDRRNAITIYGVQLIINFLWSLWFFTLQLRLFAFFWLLLMIAAIILMIRAFYKLDRPAAWLQIPYLLWSVFAAYLNFGVWLLNR